MPSNPYRSRSTLVNISAERFPGTRPYKKLSPDDLNIEYKFAKEQNFELGTMVNLHNINNAKNVNNRPGVVVGFRINHTWGTKYYHILTESGKILEMVCSNMARKDRWDCVEHYDTFRSNLSLSLTKAPAEYKSRISASIARFDHRYQPSIIWDILTPDVLFHSRFNIEFYNYTCFELFSVLSNDHI